MLAGLTVPTKGGGVGDGGSAALGRDGTSQKPTCPATPIFGTQTFGSQTPPPPAPLGTAPLPPQEYPIQAQACQRRPPPRCCTSAGLVVITQTHAYLLLDLNFPQEKKQKNWRFRRTPQREYFAVVGSHELADLRSLDIHPYLQALWLAFVDGTTYMLVPRNAGEAGGGGGGGGWHKASVSDCLPLAAPIGLSPPLILTLWGPEGVLVVSTEPLDDLSCLTTPGVGCP